MLLPWVPTTAAIINVPQDQPAIQAAIDAAQDGDEILVAPDTYTELINFTGKDIIVRSTAGPEQTIIARPAPVTSDQKGIFVGQTIRFSGFETRSAVLSGFTITNGVSGAIYIDRSSPTIINNIITGNTGAAVPTVDMRFSSALIMNNVISDNQIGGIFVGAAGAVEIIGNIIERNNGNGIRLGAAGAPIIANNLIRGNTASEGAAIYIFNPTDALIVQNVITGNITTSEFSGSVAWQVAAGTRGPFLINNTFFHNGDIEVYSAGFVEDVEIIGNIIISNPNKTAIQCMSADGVGLPGISFNNVLAVDGVAYAGNCTDQTGINGNISENPLFSASNDFRLRFGSPSIDAGDNTVPDLPALDFDGLPRIVDGNSDGTATVDQGAFENFQIFVDSYE